MIGVISKKHQLEIIKEFFQLFKTPWESYDERRSYDVVITTENETYEVNAKLLIVYGSERKHFDSREDIVIEPQGRNVFLDYDNTAVPIYGNISTLNEIGRPFMWMKGDYKVIGLRIERSERRFLRVGYDLFQEVLFLLSSGQPAEYAHIPTLEIHIAILRNLILDSGAPLIEIPPVPPRCDFITCLTHDVDFAGIRLHKFDRTMLGFVCRAVIGSYVAALRGRSSWKRLFKNWKAVLLMPAVYLGIAKDFFSQFARYIEIEKGLGSTFFVVPFKNQNGQDALGRSAKGRGVGYDVSDIKPEIRALIASGCEIGLHGIDAWWDPEKGQDELERISRVVGESRIGVRMHWLFFGKRSPRFLEKAGFSYDSTFGYNEAVGYRAGTTQVFSPLGAKRLLELPLHMQDTALFYAGRMGLTEDEAHDHFNRLLSNSTRYGGVLTINWHQRSLGPERLWGDFYIALLDQLKKYNVWFARAGDAVKWFNKRRSVSFEVAEFSRSGLKLRLSSYDSDHLPALLLRVYRPISANTNVPCLSNTKRTCFDIPLDGKVEFDISL